MILANSCFIQEVGIEACFLKRMLNMNEVSFQEKVPDEFPMSLEHR